MTLLEMKKKVLGMIEEVSPNNPALTEDPDIATKFNDVTNQIMFELIRMKKIPKYVELKVSEGDLVDFADLAKECGYEVYQLGNVGGVKFVYKADGTVLKFLESGTAEIDLYVFPERITEKTKDKSYEFELPDDVLEVMPYGIAGDLLKSDISTEYGAIYSQRFNDMVAKLDPRYHMTNIYIDGGVDI